MPNGCTSGNWPKSPIETARPGGTLAPLCVGNPADAAYAAVRAFGMAHEAGAVIDVSNPGRN